MPGSTGLLPIGLVLAACLVVAALVSQLYRGRPGCAHCGFCIGFGCEVMAKSSTLYTMIPEAEATGRCEIRPHSYVYHVALNKRGRTTGVHYFDQDKRDQFQRSRAVVVSANGGETSRLLPLASVPSHQCFGNTVS